MGHIMARATRQNQSQDKSSDRSIASAREAVGKLWLSMTLVQSRLLLLQLGALLLASGGIFTWYDKVEAFCYRHPALSIAIIAAIPLYIICFSVGPQMWHRMRKAKREAEKEWFHEAVRSSNVDTIKALLKDDPNLVGPVCCSTGRRTSATPARCR
jgi:hypothetical protein